MAPFCHLHISSFHFPMSSSRISSVYMTIWAHQPPVWGMARPQGCAKGKDAWCHVWDSFWEDEAPLCDAARWSGSGMVRSGSMAGWNSFVACTMVPHDWELWLGVVVDVFFPILRKILDRGVLGTLGDAHPDMKRLSNNWCFVLCISFLRRMATTVLMLIVPQPCWIPSCTSFAITGLWHIEVL